MSEMQVQTTLRYHFTPTRVAKRQRTDNNGIGEHVEKLEPPFISGGTVRDAASGEERLEISEDVKYV